MLRRTLIAIISFLMLALACTAETLTVYIVEYAGEQAQQLTAEAKEPVQILTEFLQSGKNGKLTVSDDGKASMVIDKVGEDLTVSAPGAEPETATVQQMLDMLASPEPPSDEKE